MLASIISTASQKRGISRPATLSLFCSYGSLFFLHVYLTLGSPGPSDRSRSCFHVSFHDNFIATRSFGYLSISIRYITHILNSGANTVDFSSLVSISLPSRSLPLFHPEASFSNLLRSVLCFGTYLPPSFNRHTCLFRTFTTKEHIAAINNNSVEDIISARTAMTTTEESIGKRDQLAVLRFCVRVSSDAGASVEVDMFLISRRESRYAGKTRRTVDNPQ